MGRFHCSFGFGALLVPVLLVMFASANASASPIATTGSPAANASRMVKFVTANQINYYGEFGECTIKCDWHDSAGLFTMGTVDLRKGEQETWTKLVDEMDFIQCEFTWTSTGKLLEYYMFSEEVGYVDPLVTMWMVTEVGLFQQARTGSYSMVIAWSG